MDSRVQEVQIWLGNTFPDYFYYDENGNNSGLYPLEPDGMTGNKTVKALIMALQIHLNLSPVDGIWGNGTSSACPTISSSTNDKDLMKIVQAGFICKGYNPGPLDGLWGNSTKQAIRDFKKDLGFSNVSDTLTPSYFKSLLTTDPTRTTITTNSCVRLVQQYLNANYSSLYLAKLGFIPTSGHFERKTSKALIYAFQSAIGTTADGVLGAQSFAKMPTLSQGSTASKQIAILQCALICNQYYVPEIDGIFDLQVENQVEAFQRFMCLDADSNVTLGTVNRRTWGALLWSCGDTQRIPNAADTRFQLTAVQAQSLFDDGYQYIGRYLTKVAGGFDKNMTDQEILAITTSGLKIIPIFQEDHNNVEAFSYQAGYNCWEKALYAATKLRLAPCTIYFGVDFDATEAQTNGVVTDFFKGLNDAKETNPSIYKIGVYSARNVCSTLCSAGLAENCYVSNMSSGYSGNLGFLMPYNWGFDQYATGQYAASDGSTIDLDKVIASGHDQGVAAVSEIGDDHWDWHPLNYDDIRQAAENATPVSEIIAHIKALEDAYWDYYPEANISTEAKNCILSVLHYLWHKKYDDAAFNALLKTNKSYCQYVDAECSDLSEELDKYIKETGYTILKDCFETSTVYPGLVELHHLAAVISAYVAPPLGENLPVKSEWFTWAGDLATAFHEVLDLTSRPSNPPIDAVSYARNRVGRMEVDSDDVQMNYCDVFGDADGFAIYTIIKNLLENKADKKNLLSSAFEIYYGKAANNSPHAHYTKRICYLLNNLPITSYNIGDISTMLYDYYLNSAQALLVSWKGKVSLDNPDHLLIIRECCTAFAEFVMHCFSIYS